MRILLVGSSGSGKTTLARALARTLGAPHVELDGLNWDRGWRNLTEEDPDEFRRRIAEAAAPDAWVMDGNYTKVDGAHWARATDIVWMDAPKAVVMRRVIWRSLNRAVSKAELWPGTGNRELFRKWLQKEHPIRWAWDNWAVIRDRYAGWFADGTYQGRPVHRVANAYEAKRLVERLAAAQAAQALPI